MEIKHLLCPTLDGGPQPATKQPGPPPLGRTNTQLKSPGVAGSPTGPHNWDTPVQPTSQRDSQAPQGGSNPLTGAREKTRSIHTPEYCSASERKGPCHLPPCGGALRTRLSEQSQTQKDPSRRTPLPGGPQRSPVHADSEERVGAGAGAEGGESVLHGDRVSVWGDGKFWRRRLGVAAGRCERASCHRAVQLETIKDHFSVLRGFM